MTLFLCDGIFYLLFMLCSFAFCTLIIGHRGVTARAPENTLASINLAWNLGADGVEIDTHLTKDKRIVIIHDESTLRTTGAEYSVRKTDSVKLRELDAGSLISPAFAGEKIPFLEEVIDTIPEGKTLFVELKSGQEILPVFKRIIEKSGKQSQISILGNSFKTVTSCKALIPYIPVFWSREIKGGIKTWIRRFYCRHIITKAKKSGLDGLSVQFDGVTERFVEEVRSANLRLYVWTVNDPDKAVYMKNLKVEGIITDISGKIKEKLND